MIKFNKTKLQPILDGKISKVINAKAVKKPISKKPLFR